MILSELMALTGATLANPGDAIDVDRPVTSGYSCDLLSWVMTHGRAGMAWVTVQTHLNVVAVASLLELACVIVPENIEVPEGTLAKASEEGVAVLRSASTAYEICGALYENGLRGGE